MPDALSLPRSDLPEEIATAIENYGHEAVVWGCSVGPQRRVDAALEALTAAILSRLGEAEDIEAPEDVLEPEWGRNCFRSVLGESYKPRVWGKHRALNYAALREVLAIEGLPDKAHDVIAAMIWNRVVVGNNAHHAFEAAAEARTERDAALDRVERLEKRVSAALDDACRMSAILLMAGEMNPQERRTAQAVANALAAKVRTALTEAGRLAIKDA